MNYILYPDVITPHYADDILDETRVVPVPIPHLSVAPYTTFRFIVGIHKKRIERVCLKSNNIVEKYIVYATKLAFQLGIGARTAIGYGIFSPSNKEVFKHYMG